MLLSKFGRKLKKTFLKSWKKSLKIAIPWGKRNEENEKAILWITSIYNEYENDKTFLSGSKKYKIISQKMALGAYIRI